MRKRYELKRKKREANHQMVAGAADHRESSAAASSREPRDHGIVKRFSRVESAASHVSSLCMIKQTYPDAIEYTAIARGTRGAIMLIGLVASAFAFSVAYFGSHDLWDNDHYGFFEYQIFTFSLIFVLVGIYQGVKAVRLELFRPQDEPTIFDRKNRKVYRIYREAYSGWRGLFAHWPLKRAEHDWDLIDAEHHAAVMTTGSTVTRLHGLIFLVRKSSTDPTPVDSFAIGNGMQMGEITVPAVWEHIRRFMEEGGPHLPPNETLQPYRQPTTFWQCMAAPFPSLSQLRAWWPDELPMMLMGLVFSPIILPIMVVLGVFTWLAHLTSISVSWSPEVLQAIGEPATTTVTSHISSEANHSGART